MRILYLDDDCRMESLLRRLARREGHSLEFHASIQTFKEALGAGVPDLLLLDLGLGQESGVDVIEWLAAERIESPLVLLSGYGEGLLETVQRLARGAGLRVRGYVSKHRLMRDLPPLLVQADPPSPQPSRGQAPVELDPEQLSERIEKRAVVPFFQPIVRAVDGGLQGVEVLARLRLSSGELLGAPAFIPLAERSGLIDRLTQVLFERLVGCKERLRRLGLEYVSVNLSRQTIAGPDSVNLIRALVDGLGDACQVSVEITESVVSEDPQMLRRVAAQIELLGATLAMDDFGTGYSSLRDLVELPFRTLKIDLGFVAEMFDSPKSRAAVEATIALGRYLDLRLVAEGVETEAQRDALAAAGVDLLQGYLYGRPCSLDEFERIHGAHAA